MVSNTMSATATKTALTKKDYIKTLTLKRAT